MKMKLRKSVILIVASSLVFGLMNGCGGGGGSNASSTPTETEDSVFVEQNEYAQQSVPDSYALYEALNEETRLITNALGEEWGYREWTEDDIRSVLSEEEIEKLASQLAAIHNDKVIPSAEAAGLSLNALNSTEQEIQNLLNRSVGSYTRIAAIPVIPIAVAILSAFTAFGLAVAEESKKNEPDGESATEKLQEAIDWAKLMGDNLVEGGKAGVTSLATSVATFGASNWAAAVKWYKLQFVIDKASDVKTVSDIVVGVNKCYPKDTPVEKQADLILNALDSNVDGDIEISYLGKSDENGVFHNIPEGDMTFVLFSEGNVRSVSSCIDFSGDEDFIIENITVTSIAEFEDVIDEDDEIIPDPNTDSSNIQVNIPGYTNTFASNLTTMTFGSLNDGPYIYPAFVSADANSPEEFNILTNDTFSMIFNTTLSAGNTYPLTDDFELVNADVRFTTPHIVDKNGIPIVFAQVSGSFTLTEYGTNVGDRLSVSFSCNVIGKRSGDGDEDEDIDIYGSISGTFNGTLSAVEQYVAVSKSINISF